MIDLTVAQALRSDGHDVVRASDFGMSRADDAAILHQAQAEQRVLVTLDRHFGDWTVLPLSQHPGVVRVRVSRATAPAIISVLLPYLRGRDENDLRNRLIIVSSDRVRSIKTSDG